MVNGGNVDGKQAENAKHDFSTGNGAFVYRRREMAGFIVYFARGMDE